MRVLVPPFHCQRFSQFSHSSRYLMFLICFSLMTNDFEHIFMHLFALSPYTLTHISPLGEYLFKYFLHFNWVFSFLFLIFTFSFFIILAYSVTVVPICHPLPSSTQPHPAPTVNPQAIAQVHGSFTLGLRLIPSSSFHHSPFPPPLRELSACSMFPRLSFCLACQFILFIRFIL